MNDIATASDIQSSEPHRFVLVAGCGYVGLRVARRWKSEGFTTFAITRSIEKAEQLAAEGIHPQILNLGSAKERLALPDADVVLWSMGFDRSPGSDRQALWVDGLQNLLETLPPRAQPRRIIYTSSTGVYGDGNGREVDELTPANPDSEGGKACVAAEQILQNFARDTGNQVFILRLAGIYGPDRLLRRIAELRNGTPLRTTPDDWLNLIHVDDAVRVIEWCARPKSWEHCDSARNHPEEMTTRIMNVVAAGSVSRRTYYSALANLVGAPEPVFEPSPDLTTRTASHRRQSGNRRVISRFRSTLPLDFQFDDCATGLAHAVSATSALNLE